MSLSTKAKLFVPMTREGDGEFALTPERYTKVQVAEFANGITCPTFTVRADDTVSSAIFVISATIAATKSVIAAMANTMIQIREVCITNESTVLRRFDLRWGNTVFWKQGIVGSQSFNLNFIGGYPQGTQNKKLVIGINGGATGSGTIFYKRKTDPTYIGDEGSPGTYQADDLDIIPTP